LSSFKMQHCHRRARGLRQDHRDLCPAPGRRRSIDEHEDVEPGVAAFFAFDAAGDSDGERPGEFSGAVGDLLVKVGAFRRRLAADYK
jgi:hypothetical protein